MMPERYTVSVWGGARIRKRVKTKSPRYKVKSYTRYQRVKRRFVFSGSGSAINRAIKLAGKKWVPKDRITSVRAEDFLESPRKYGRRGIWTYVEGKCVP